MTPNKFSLQWLSPDCPPNLDPEYETIRLTSNTLHLQIALLVPNAAAVAEPGSAAVDAAAPSGEDGDLFTMEEMRAELERLRGDAPADASGAAEAGAAGGPCVVPAAVPEIPPGMRVVGQMQMLVDTIVRAESKLRVGFHGMGGSERRHPQFRICPSSVPETGRLRVTVSDRPCAFAVGKTTTSAWVCRQDVVRDQFDALLWVSLGHDPNLKVFMPW